MLLQPKAFAVIGASREKQKVGYTIFNNLLKSRIKTYPINPNAKNILGVKCYASITELKGKVSHAVIAVPAPIVPRVIEECVNAQVKTAIIISAGFSEVGNKKLEEQVLMAASKNGMRILGPNVLGVIVPGEFNASFFNGEIKLGGVTFISQSGALGVAVLDQLISNGEGLRSFISVGNTSDLTINDALREAINENKTKCVLIYAESLKNGREFMNLCKKSKKPIFILKAGTSSEGAKAATTHTGSLAGSDDIYTAAFKQCGAIRVESLSELINTGLLCEKHGLLGNKALIITNAGGPGILMTDSLVKNGVKLPSLPNKLINKLNKELKGVAWSHNNPIDVLGDAQAERYAKVLREVSKHKFYDYLIVLLTPQAMTQPLETAHEIIKFKQKPVLTCFLGGNSVKQANELLKNKGVTVFSSINETTETVSNLKN